VLALLCATQAVPLSRPGVKSSPAEDLGDSDDVGVSRMWADDPALDGGWEGEATERGAPPPLLRCNIFPTHSQRSNPGESEAELAMTRAESHRASGKHLTQSM